jgi:hypothetical protein
MKRLIFTTIATAILLPMALYLFRPSQAPQQANMNGPILYAITSAGELYKIDVMNCDICPVATLTGFDDGAGDLLVLPNGDILVQAGSNLCRYTLPNTTPIWSNNEGYGGSIIGSNGTIYLNRVIPQGLSTYDPATNATTYIGPWPPNISVSEFFYQNGILYAQATLSGDPVTLEVNLGNPDQSTVVQANGLLIVAGGTTNNGYTTAVNASTKLLHQYNASTNTVNLLCDFSAIFPGEGINGLTDLPPGVQEVPCQCLTDAGSVDNNTFNLCVPGSVTVPYNNDAVLDGNDILRYILFSNPNDTLGSIIVQSSSATITFNAATMQTGVTYYLATVAGNNLGGNVDPDDPCLNISNAAQVIWRPRPTVVLSIDNPTLCAGDCRTVTATFTGTPPFTLTYTTPAGVFTQEFSDNTGTFEVCVPAGVAPGGLQVQATGVTDAWCGCE